MSRISDTRELTRTTAARLVAAGRPSHELTVDLIYAEIKQGSRTTINDELKLWKDKQAKLVALTAGLPAEVADAMVNIWAMAVDHGEKVFDERREEIESQLEQATAQVSVLDAEKADLTRQFEGVQINLAKGQSELNETRETLSSERTAKDAAIARNESLVQHLEAVKSESAQAILILKAEHQQRVEEMQTSLATQEIAFRQELDKTTQRLEGVQRHVMLQVEEAREARKRTEVLLSKSSQKNEQLTTELQQSGQQIALFTQLSERAKTDLAQAQTEMIKFRTERESLVLQLANANGKLDAMGEQVGSLERRAVGAETRLEEALQRPAAGKKKVEKMRRT